MFNLAEFPLELVKPEQININGKKTVLRGETVTYTADSKNISKFTPSEVYYWIVDSPDGEMRVKGPSVTVDFDEKGEYIIKCGTINVDNTEEKLATYIKINVDEARKNSLFGDGKENVLFRDALGDFIAINETNNKCLTYSNWTHFKSNHAGYMDDEILVPLIIIDKCDSKILLSCSIFLKNEVVSYFFSHPTNKRQRVSMKIINIFFIFSLS